MFAQSRHRLGSSYDLLAPPPLSSAQPFPSVESHFSEPLTLDSNCNEDIAYSYFDPWDDCGDSRAPQESYQSHNSLVSNSLNNSGSGEINCDYIHSSSECDRLMSGITNVSPRFDESQQWNRCEANRCSNHTEFPPDVEVPIDFCLNNINVGDTQLGNGSSRRSSFSRPVESECRVFDDSHQFCHPENNVVVETHCSLHLAQSPTLHLTSESDVSNN